MAKVIKLREVEKEEVKSEVVLFGKISSIDERMAGSGSKYIDFAISDANITLYGKSWNTELANFDVQVGDIVKMMVEVDRYNDKIQLKVIKDKKSNAPKIRKITPEDGVDESEFIKLAPRGAEMMYNTLVEIVEAFKDDEYKRVAMTVLERYKNELLFFSGGLKVHHAYKAGLLYHIYSMVTQAQIKGDIYPEVNIERLVTGCIVHDIGKLKEIEVDENGTPIRYTLRGALLGHIVDGILMLDEIFREKNISEETQVMLHHMIASHHYEPSWGSMSLPRFIEAELLHILDMGDSRIDQIVTATNAVNEGEFTEKVYFLGNREMYRPHARELKKEEPVEQIESEEPSVEMSQAI